MKNGSGKLLKQKIKHLRRQRRVSVRSMVTESSRDINAKNVGQRILQIRYSNHNKWKTQNIQLCYNIVMNKQENQKVLAFNQARDEWIDSLIMENCSKFTIWMIELFQKKIADEKMNAFWRAIHFIWGYFFMRLEIKHAQNYEMHKKGKGGFKKDMVTIKSVKVEVLLNKKTLGEKTFPLGVMAQHG
jgi:hypothetical protein